MEHTPQENRRQRAAVAAATVAVAACGAALAGCAGGLSGVSEPAPTVTVYVTQSPGEGAAEGNTGAGSPTAESPTSETPTTSPSPTSTMPTGQFASEALCSLGAVGVEGIRGGGAAARALASAIYNNITNETMKNAAESIINGTGDEDARNALADWLAEQCQ